MKGDEKRDYVHKMFSRISRRYDLMNTLMTLGRDSSWRDLAAEQATYGLCGPALDVGTGTGELALALSRQPSTTDVIGIDLLESMISLAKQKLNTNETKITFMTGDALSLPFPDNTFACVTSGFILRNVPDLEASLREMLRVVKPSGRILSLETMDSSNPVLRPITKSLFRIVVPLLGFFVAGDYSAYRYLPKSVDSFLSHKELLDLFSSIGLVNLGHRSLALGTIHLHWGTKPEDSLIT